MNSLRKSLCLRFLGNASIVFLTATLSLIPCLGEKAKKAPPETENDVLVLNNGDTLHGKLVKEVSGKVTFHINAVGDVDFSWDDIKELHASESFGVLQKGVKQHGKRSSAQIPTGQLDVTEQAIKVRGANAPATPVPVKDAVFVVDATTLDNQINHHPGFFTGWNGAATAGATLVQATQNQYTVSGGIGLVRTVPSVSWLDPRNRTQADFTGSYGKITQPGSTPVKSSIYHLDAERDQYMSARIFGLVQVAFDHNFAQDLQLQQIYGGGLGWTMFSTPKQEADLKATVQYEKQKFITGTAGTSQNLIGSTFSLTYIAKLDLFSFTQNLAYIPAYNTPRAYSADETDTLAFPVYKNFGFSVGTIDSYLNNPPATVPPTKRNSFQFTMGLTYAIKSKY
jgi:hypothetical protein